MLNKLFNKCLIISPHPDDSEYSCFGLIKASSATFDLLICSEGGLGDRTNDQNRVREVYDFWNTSKHPVKINFQNIINNEYSSIVKHFDKLIVESKFDAIFVPPEQDTNQEHRLISQICKSSLRDKPCALIEYWTPSTTHEWNPNVWLDIGENFSQKKQLLLSSFKSQLGKSYFEEEYIDLFHQDWQASKKGIRSCEKYKIITWMCK